ncbi:MAG: PIG-L family deacetylase [Cyclobacteriaceae bacterium]|jgi:LmbE family N-acetylglucosaminyl deacetylase|nr:PIG-L family deacetylase [Cyclobacteriaceae bacterium]MDH4298605.1 PIG-L family deacetylase [Cyclobacteriaceae bacterium]MDH5249185.1 PIG-L family deacetylase [Cyclobacteriaceae bacterium]
MQRRNFIEKSMLAGAFATPAIYGSFSRQDKGSNILKADNTEDEVVIEHPAKGRPHVGKVLAVIQPHCDDIPLFASGTVAKLIHEGYTGYLIRTTNDDAAGTGNSVGERILNNEKDNDAVARVLGLDKVYDLGYKNHRMDEYNIQEIKGRLIFLFRLLKVDTVISYDPWGHYEENPDHYVTAKAVEAARWMAGSEDYPEQLEVVEPHAVTERYYFSRGPQLVNRIVDISPFIDKKIESNLVCKTQGPGGNNGALLKKTLSEKGKKLAILGPDDVSANINYIKNFVLDIDSHRLRSVPSDRLIGEKYGLEWAESFHYFGPETSLTDQYVEKNAVPK